MSNDYCPGYCAHGEPHRGSCAQPLPVGPANPPAFPCSPGDVPFWNEGMTLRDWFAGGIANGMAAHSGTSGGSFGPGEIAQRSYEIANAMLAERAKGGAA